MQRYEEIERGITTTYRKKIWLQFIKGVKEFDMVNEGDKIAICISGGKDSMLLAKCMQELKKHKKVTEKTFYPVRRMECLFYIIFSLHLCKIDIRKSPFLR